MLLHEFPEAIATQQRTILSAQKAVRAYQDGVNRLTGIIDSEVAFNKELTNDTQRKTMRKAKMEEPKYKDLAECLQVAEDKLKELEIDLQLLRDRFSIAKMGERRAIAEMEMQVAA